MVVDNIIIVGKKKTKSERVVADLSISVNRMIEINMISYGVCQ
jgi:hypothetical protein